MANRDWIKKAGPDGLTFGERIGDLIFKKGITQSQLASATGIPQSAISEYVNGKKDGTVLRAADCASIIALAKYFSVSTDYLLGLTSIKTPETEIRDIVEKTGLSEQNVQRLIAYCTSASNGTADAARALGLLSEPGEETNIKFGKIGLAVVNDVMDAFIAENDILAGYLHILPEHSRISSETEYDPLLSAALAHETNIPGYALIQLTELIRFESDRVAKAIGDYLVHKYIGDGSMSDYGREE